jgi:DNA-binding transcriptional MerR regulator
MQPHLSTMQIARAVGVHPNTVRMYETWGFLPPIPRSPSGYRLYTELHLAQMRLARTALHGVWPGPEIRHSALALVRLAASGDFTGALALARRHLTLVQGERAQAEAAAAELERWAGGEAVSPAAPGLSIREAAALLHVTPDALRNWERNGLLKVPRQPGNRYRTYGSAEIARLRIIRTLRQAGYSPMAILRMLLQLDQGHTRDLAKLLDTPRPDEDVYSASDRWLSTLAEQEARAQALIDQLAAMCEQFSPQ